MNRSTDPLMQVGRFTSAVPETTRPVLGSVLAMVAAALFTVVGVSQAPAATTGAAINIGGTTATLNGTVNANDGGMTIVTFEYGLDANYGGAWTAAESPVSGSMDTPVTANVTGLNSETTYHYRVVGVNANGTTSGDDMTFTTLDVIPPTVTSIVRQNPTSEYTNANAVTLRVTFDEDVQNVGPAGFALSGAASGSIHSVSTITADSVYDVEITDVVGDGELDLGIANGNDIQDTAGNPLGNTPTIGTEETYTIDNIPPSIPIGLSPASNSYTTDTSPTLSWEPSDDTGGSGLRTTNTYRVVVTGMPGKDYYTPTPNPEYTPTLAEGVFTWKVYARDNAGNASDYSIICTLTIDETSPGVTIDQAGTQADPTNGSPVVFTVAFDEPIDIGTFKDGDVMVGGTATTAAVTLNEIAPKDGTTFSVSVVITGDGTVTVTIPAGGVEDPAGNTNTASNSTDNTLTYDTTAPIDPTSSSSSHAVSVVSNDPTVDIEISGSADPTSNGVASGVDGFDSAWDRNATWTTTTKAKDHEETWAGGTFMALPDGDWYFHIATVDNAGNWTSTQHLGPFPIDTDPPMVSDVTVSDTQITDADTPGTATFIVTVDFDEAMDTSVDPTLVFSPGVATTLTLNVGQSGWTDSEVYVAKYDVVDGNVDHDSATIDVTGAQDPAGNGQTGYTPEPEFEIDTLNPTVASVTATPTRISDATAGTDTFTVTTVFSETMDAGTTPTLVFNPTDKVTTGSTPTLSSPSGSWGGTTDTYTVTYDVADQNVDVDSVAIDVTGGQDLAGNGQADYKPVHEFEIDTKNPTIVSITSTTPDGYYDVGANINITVAFSEPVTLSGGGLDVMLNIPADVVGVASFGPATSAATGYTVGTDDNSCDLDAIGVVFDDVMGGGLRDNAGNDANVFLPATTIANGSDIVIDTTDPVISGLDLPDTEQSVDENCTITIPYSATVADNCCVNQGVGASDFQVLIEIASGAGTATLDTPPATITSVDIDEVEIEGSFTVSDLTASDVEVQVRIDCLDCAANSPAEVSDMVTIGNNTVPVISGLDLPGGDLPVDPDTCTYTVDYSATVTDNCCIDAGSVTVDVELVPGLDTATLDAPPARTKNEDVVTPNDQVNVSGSFTVSALTDAPVEVCVWINATDCNGNAAAESTDTATFVDTTIPVISWDTDLPGGLQYVSADTCTITFPLQATLRDACCIDAGNVDIDIGVGSATLAHTVTATQVDQGQVRVAGDITVSALTACPAELHVTIAVRDCAGNEAIRLTDSVEILDNTSPMINDLMFNTDDSYDVQETDYSVDDCCLVPIHFSANVTDNCYIAAGNVDVMVTLPTGNAVLEDIVVDRVQNGQNRVDVTGRAVVRCLASCPARVEVHVEATDCCENDAVPQTTKEAEGLVYDETEPTPRDDPRQDVEMDESAILDPLVKVGVDKSGTYRLLVREGSSVRIDVVANDADNCSCVAHDACDTCIGCDAVVRVHGIVDAPSNGAAAIFDVERMTRGDTTMIRYAPARGFSGSDQFTYRIVDACGNVSKSATVYVEVIARSSMEDLFLTTCAETSVEFDVTVKDPWMDPEDPGSVPFEFSILTPPTHGVVSGDLTGLAYTAAGATTDDPAGATVVLTYTPAAGYVGRDRMTVQCVDPFGGSSEAVIDVAVDDCTETAEEPTPIAVERGVMLSMILPSSFRSILEGKWGSVLLVSVEDGLAYSGVLSAMRDESAGQYVLEANTEGLTPGEYRLIIPLGNGETVELTIEIGEAE